MSKAIRVGGEVDSYCTKCRLVLNHRIVSILDGKPAKVLCLTCTSPEARMYRPYPPGQKPPAAGGKASAAASGSKAGTSTPRPTRAAAAAAREAQERNDRERSWEKAIAGKAVTDFKAYRISLTFQEGDLIRHARFGDGFVTRVLDPRKIEVLFKEEPKVLAHGMEQN